MNRGDPTHSRHESLESRIKFGGSSGVFGGVRGFLELLELQEVRGKKFCGQYFSADEARMCHIRGGSGRSGPYGALGAFKFAPNA